MLCTKNPILNMPFHGSCQHNAFNRTADALELVDVVAMAHPLYVLLDDRTAVKLFGYVVSSGTDDFDTRL